MVSDSGPSRIRLYPGLAVCFISCASAWWAFFERRDYVLFPVSLGLAVLVFAGGALTLGLGVFARGLSPGREELRGCVGDRVAVIPWPRWFFLQPLVRVEVEWISPRAGCEFSGGAGGFSEQICFQRRLKSSSVTRRVRFEDWLGLWIWEFEKTDSVPLCIEPARVPPVGQAPHIHHENGQGEEGEGSADGDLLEFRTYQQGDSANRIMWKLLDRTGNLYSRKPEKSGSALVGIFLVCATGDEPAAELAWYATNKEEARSQDFFGENWVFGTSADYGEGAENRSPVASSEWQRCREIILSSGGEDAELPPGDLRQRVQSFIEAAGPGLTSVMVLVGGENPRFLEEGLPTVCQVLHVTRGVGQKTLDWSHLER
jgi:hypothetical protein